MGYLDGYFPIILAGVNAATCVILAYSLYKIPTKDKKRNPFTLLVFFIKVDFLLQLCSILVLGPVYLFGPEISYPGSKTYVIGWMIFGCLAYLIPFLNLLFSILFSFESLGIFSCIQDTFSKPTISRLRNVYLFVFIMIMTPGFYIIVLYQLKKGTTQLDLIGVFMSVLLAAASIIYNTLQTLFLLHLLYSGSNRLVAVRENCKQDMIRLMIFLMVLDWLAVGIFVVEYVVDLCCELLPIPTALIVLHTALLPQLFAIQREFVVQQGEICVHQVVMRTVVGGVDLVVDEEEDGYHDNGSLSTSTTSKKSTDHLIEKSSLCQVVDHALPSKATSSSSGGGGGGRSSRHYHSNTQNGKLSRRRSALVVPSGPAAASFSFTSTDLESNSKIMSTLLQKHLPTASFDVFPDSLL